MTKKKAKYNSKEYKEWRAKIFRRDRYTCKMCGSKGSLQAHHIRRKHDYPHLTLDPSNGISLCRQCHYIVTGREAVFEKLFLRIIQHTVTLDFVYTFFARLITKCPRAVTLLKSYNKWDYIPQTLVKHIKTDKIINNVNRK